MSKSDKLARLVFFYSIPLVIFGAIWMTARRVGDVFTLWAAVVLYLLNCYAASIYKNRK